MNEFAELLIKNNISIGTVESFMLGNIPGISKVYKGSLVTYQSETKERLLGIEHPLIEKYGVVSKEIATLMCVNGKSILDVDLCVSFTGNAGPDAMEGKPVGEVYIGIAYEDVVVYKLNLEGSRKEIALKASYSTSSSSVPSGRIYPQLSHTPSSASIPSFTKASMPPGS